MKVRSASINRITNETNVSLSLTLDGDGKRTITTPVGFLTHMLDLFAKNGNFDLSITAKGDTWIDEHHLVEDIGIVLGLAFAKALGDKRGINRYGFFILPMDEAVATVAIDCSGRYAFTLQCPFNSEKIGDMSSELIYDFWEAFAQNAKVNLYIKVENGRNDHHKAEAIWKAAGRACRMAVALDPKMGNTIPSTKGIL